MQKKRFFCQPWVFCFLPEEQKQRVSIRIIETNCDRRLSWRLSFVPCLMFWACGGGNFDGLSWSRTAPFCVLCRSKRAVVNCRNMFWDFLLWFGRVRTFFHAGKSRATFFSYIILFLWLIFLSVPYPTFVRIIISAAELRWKKSAHPQTWPVLYMFCFHRAASKTFSKVLHASRWNFKPRHTTIERMEPPNKERWNGKP